MFICTVIEDKVQSLNREGKLHSIKQDVHDDNDGAYLKSIGIEI